MSPYNITEAELESLNLHVYRSSKAKKDDYERIASLARKIKQKPYRKVIYRGFHIKAAAIQDLLLNKPFKFSATAGLNKYAESWSTDYDVAKRFAHVPWQASIIMKAKPRPSDFVIHINNDVIEVAQEAGDYYEEPLMVDAIMDMGGDESEIIVKTGNRKYTLCRNIVFLKAAPTVLDLKKNKRLRDLFLARIKNEKNKKLFMDDIETYPVYYWFACLGGKLAYFNSEKKVADFSHLMSG